MVWLSRYSPSFAKVISPLPSSCVWICYDYVLFLWPFLANHWRQTDASLTPPLSLITGEGKKMIFVLNERCGEQGWSKKNVVDPFIRTPYRRDSASDAWARYHLAVLRWGTRFLHSRASRQFRLFWCLTRVPTGCGRKKCLLFPPTWRTRCHTFFQFIFSCCRLSQTLNLNPILN